MQSTCGAETAGGHAARERRAPVPAVDDAHVELARGRGACAVSSLPKSRFMHFLPWSSA